MSASQQTPHAGQVRFSRPDWGWTKRAQCRGEDLSLFFGPPSGDDREYPPAKRDREAEAKWICGGCPVRDECLQYALDEGEKFGIWGGLNEEERKRFRRNQVERERKQRKADAA